MLGPSSAGMQNCFEIIIQHFVNCLVEKKRRHLGKNVCTDFFLIDQQKLFFSAVGGGGG